MPSTCHRHFTPSSPDGSNVPGVPYRKTCVNCFQSFKAGFCAECRGFVAYKRLKENKHATHVDVNGKEMCPQKRKDGGKFATGSQRASRKKIKQDRFDQLAPRRLLRLGSTTPASQWNGRMVLAKNPFKMQEEDPPWETLHEAFCGAKVSEANVVSGKGEIYISNMPTLAQPHVEKITVALREGRRCEEGGEALRDAIMGAMDTRPGGSAYMSLNLSAMDVSQKALDRLNWSPLQETLQKHVKIANNRNEAVTVLVSIGEVFARLHQDTTTGPHVLVHGRKRWTVCDAGVDVPKVTVYNGTEEGMSEIDKYLDEASLLSRGDTMIVQHRWHHAVHSTGLTIGVMWYFPELSESRVAA